MAYNPSTGIGTTRTAGNSDRDLALKIFSGEVLTAFAGRNTFMPLVNVRTIQNGKSAQFPVIGTYDEANILDHVPGNDITVSTIGAGERVITIDSRKYASVFLDDFEEAMSHYEVRGQYSTEIGNALASKVDKAIVAQLDACASATAEVGQPSTNADLVLGATLDANTIVEAIFEAVGNMESKDIYAEKICVVKPEVYYTLVQSDKAVNRDWTTNNGGIDSGQVFSIAGVKIMMSNNVSAGQWGYIFTPQAVGVVKLMDIKSEANYIPEKLGTLLTSHYAMGEGVLNPGCSVRLTVA